MTNTVPVKLFLDNLLIPDNWVAELSEYRDPVLKVSGRLYIVDQVDTDRAMSFDSWEEDDNG